MLLSVLRQAWNVSRDSAMTKKLSIISFLFLFCLIKLNAQNIGANKTALSTHLLKFIPKGYALLDTAKGDLNLDNFQDIILVLKTIGEDTALDATEYKRPILILLGHADKSFSLAARNDNVVYCFQCGGVFGDPYDGIEIKDGFFTVHHFGGSNERWSNDITFKYLKTDNKWYLLKIVDKGWNVFHLNKVDTTIKTKKDFGIVSFEKYTDDDK
jgi:hypothetical protein